MGRVKKRVVVLGSTGSIGAQALEIIEDNPDLFELVGVSAHGSKPEALVEQIRRFGLSGGQVAVASPRTADLVDAEVDGHVIRGTDSARYLVEQSELGEDDVVLNALVGSLGLDATLATLEGPAKLALANKESLVAGGQLVLDTADDGQLLPVDSEHSAVAQCLRSGEHDEVAELVLTASGGPFIGYSREELQDVTPLQAANHPTWSMGQINTLNASTMVNKGLEVIEAGLLFDVPADKITVTVHPQKVVHSMVTFTDGTTIAQAAPRSMKLPISHALGWPRRVAGVQQPLDFREAQSWAFEPLDESVFSAVRLAREAVTAGGCMPAVYNAANEEAAVEFLTGTLSFPHIVDTIDAVLQDCAEFTSAPQSIEDVLTAERAARSAAHERMSGWISG
ncbi:MAG TPA: 1-deoxy-D-xylulose-5-phosphate reductoisomerase [Candidatus Corynebacterium avicola]|uniref:1-deoxy-D-xylulose 5-phosphate reductoisomerase n=1 Tax=Candidatus Corynebacterium avicola TaxID=2838527 RepID=A0A9D1UMB3_9CORY|nr:1-deoxy-D-xylulose-5-phosphate reductoisomerase [Candidatus Corynebacterium avicola]